MRVRVTGNVQNKIEDSDGGAYIEWKDIQDPPPEMWIAQDTNQLVLDSLLSKLLTKKRTLYESDTQCAANHFVMDDKQI